ncbi:MAG: aconitate hydratase [Clostridia bacterium]|nr:aconitate hydratase [Clostridia bacterium]
MGLTLAEKIIKAHLRSGEMVTGSEIGLKIDQTLTQDATGTMAYLEFETMGLPRVNTELSVAYIDHNTLQSGFENADDHRYIQSVAKKYGLRFSRPGNGICHQVHLERLGIPGKTLIGSDSHTPTAGGLGMLSFGAGGLDVAVAMGGGTYYISMPKIIKVNLTGKLNDYVSAKDVSLEILRRIDVKGGVGCILEWAGEGVKTLSVPERATITNMGTETGATSSIFPSDERTLEFLKAQGREDAFVALAADEDAVYADVIDINLSELEPLIAMPHSPGKVVTVKSIEGMKVDQVCAGSCTNSSLVDMLKIANILKGKTVAESVSMSVSPGSKQVLSMLSECGALSDILASGARVLECACGPCIGMGFSPNSGGVSLRTFNRNFEGRSGTKDAQVYLVSPETAAASAITGVITDPRSLGKAAEITIPANFKLDDSAIIMPASIEEAKDLDVVRGPNIKPFPNAVPQEDTLAAELILKLGDNISTDHIMPAGAKVLPYRSNIPKISEFCFGAVDETFPIRAKTAGKSIIVAANNYGQGSSREHAALAPMYLGVRAVIAKSLARIHAANLINVGIISFTFENEADYDLLEQGDKLSIKNVFEAMDTGHAVLKDETKGIEINLCCSFTQRQKDILKAGGLLEYTKQNGK